MDGSHFKNIVPSSSLSYFRIPKTYTYYYLSFLLKNSPNKQLRVPTVVIENQSIATS
jgi:hypothetical protein